MRIRKAILTAALVATGLSLSACYGDHPGRYGDHGHHHGHDHDHDGDHHWR